MRVYLLRTTGGDPDYERVEADSVGAVQRLTRAAEPPSRLFDPAQDEGAFVHAVMCQGVSLQTYDHYAIRPGSVLRLYGWNDDEEDARDGRAWPEPDHAPWGVIWEFRKPKPDPAVGGRVNTVQRLTVYGADDFLAGETTTGGPVVHRPWSEWVDPPPGLTFHGCWTDDETNDRHLRALARGNAAHGWREWL